MAGVFKQRERDQLVTFQKPTQTEYRDKYGATRVAPPNTMAYEYNQYGHMIGVVFGGGATMTIPVNNKVWNANADSTLILMGDAPEGEIIARWGSTEIIGVGGVKLYIVNIDADTASTNGNEILVFPDAPMDTEKSRHISVIKYYGEYFIFPDFEEEMTELNTFVNGDFLV